DTTNNLEQKLISITYREPDLQVTDMIAPPQASSGETIPVKFSVTNLGTRDTRSGGWADSVFLSRDPSLNSSDLFLGSFTRSGVLAKGDSYSGELNVRLPDSITGDFHLLVYTDSAAEEDPFGTSDIGYGHHGIAFLDGASLVPWDMASI